MDSPRHQFLAGTALAVNEHGAAGGRDGPDGLLQFFDGDAVADHVFQRVAAGRIALVSGVLSPQDNGFHRTGHRHLEFFQQPRPLVNVIEGPALHCLHGSLIIFHRCNQDDRGFRRYLPGEAQDFNAVSLRHLDVSDQHFIICRTQFFLGGLSGIHGLNFVAFFAQ